MLKSRKMTPDPFVAGDLPNKVVIKELSKKFEAVEMDHGKHVTALMNGMKDNQLANYFHSEPGTMCQGCHHNSPASNKPAQLYQLPRQGPRCRRRHQGSEPPGPSGRLPWAVYELS